MNEQTFSRKSATGLITLAFGVLFVYYGISHTEYNYIPPIFKFISAGLAFIYAIWQFATPYVIINDSNIIIKKDILSTKFIEINKIDNISIYDDEIQIRSSLDTLKIKLKVLGSEDRETLLEKFNRIKEKKE